MTPAAESQYRAQSRIMQARLAKATAIIALMDKYLECMGTRMTADAFERFSKMPAWLKLVKQAGWDDASPDTVALIAALLRLREGGWKQ